MLNVVALIKFTIEYLTFQERVAKIAFFLNANTLKNQKTPFLGSKTQHFKNDRAVVRQTIPKIDTI